MRLFFFGFISLAGMCFGAFSLYSQAYGVPGIALPPPFSPPLPVDAVWIGIAIALMSGAYALRGRLSFCGFYWSCALAVVGFFLSYTFSFAPYSVILSYDSLDYLLPVVKEGRLPSERIPGYPLFLGGVHKIAGLHLLPPIQLFSELMAYFLAGYVLLRCFQIWRALSPFILAFPIVFPPFIDYSFSILTEALFLSGFTVGGAALAAAVKSLESRDFLWSGLGIALAAAVKSIGIVLVLPVFLILRFIPLKLWWKPFLFSALPALALYGSVCWVNYKRTGQFSAETSRGFVLLTHVSGFLDGEVADPPGLSESIKKAIKPIIDKRPKNLFPINSLQALEQYIITTRKEHLAADQTIRQIGEQKIASPVERDVFYHRLALTSIAHHPFLYAGQVGAHFYCMWTVACMPIKADIIYLPIELRSQPSVRSGFTSEKESEARRIGEFFAGNMPPASEPNAAKIQRQIPLLSKNIPKNSWSDLIADMSPKILLFSAFLALFLLLIYVFSKKLARIYASPITLALFINVYFLAHALFSYCGETRYGWVATPLIFFLLLTVLKTVFRSKDTQILAKENSSFATGNLSLPKSNRSFGTGNLFAKRLQQN